MEVCVCCESFILEMRKNTRQEYIDANKIIGQDYKVSSFCSSRDIFRIYVLPRVLHYTTKAVKLFVAFN